MSQNLYQPSSELPEYDSDYWIAGFWRRVFAYIVDTFFLAFICFVLSRFFADIFIQMGVWGIFVGFFVALVYFSFLNSKIGGGQTLGKRLLKIKVVDKNNQLISFQQSILRYIILAIPFTLNGAGFTKSLIDTPLIYLISLLIFTGFFGNLYLIIFSRQNRQLIHDLLLNTVVVNEYSDISEVKKTSNKHFIVLTVILFCSLGLPATGTYFIKQFKLESLLELHEKISEQPHVISNKVNLGSTITSLSSNKKPFSYISVVIQMNDSKLTNKDQTDQFLEIVKEYYPEYTEVDQIIIMIVSGYSIGYWSSSNHFTMRYNLKK